MCVIKNGDVCMLTHAIVKYVFHSNQEIEFYGEPSVKICFVDYINKLVQDGFLLRSTTDLYADSKNRTVYLSGTLASKSALDDAHELVYIKNLLKRIDTLLSDFIVNYFETNEDYHYCEHKTLKSLILECDHISHVPSLKCGDCGGIVANYLVNMQQDIALNLWSWERQYDALSDISSTCGEYEEWAEKQLNDVNSKINQLGLSITKALSKQLGFGVLYSLDAGDFKSERCPACEQPLVDIKTYKKCVNCMIIIKKAVFEQ